MWLSGNLVTALTSFSFSPSYLMKFIDQLFPTVTPDPLSELKSVLCGWTPEMPQGGPVDLSSCQAGSPDALCGQYFSLHTSVPDRTFPFPVKENWCGWWGLKIVSFISSPLSPSPLSTQSPHLPFPLSPLFVLDLESLLAQAKCLLTLRDK